MNLENGMTTQSENAILWIEKLLTAKKDGIKQRKRHLGNHVEGFCCLGYGCAVTKTKYSSRAGSSKQFQDAVGLRTDCGSATGVAMSCVSMNDYKGLSFSQIAGQLKGFATGYFIPEVAQSIKEHFA
jgi:hypothetical protein